MARHGWGAWRPRTWQHLPAGGCRAADQELREGRAVAREINYLFTLDAFWPHCLLRARAQSKRAQTPTDPPSPSFVPPCSRRFIALDLGQTRSRCSPLLKLYWWLRVSGATPRFGRSGLLGRGFLWLPRLAAKELGLWVSSSSSVLFLLSPLSSSFSLFFFIRRCPLIWYFIVLVFFHFIFFLSFSFLRRLPYLFLWFLRLIFPLTSIFVLFHLSIFAYPFPPSRFVTSSSSNPLLKFSARSESCSNSFSFISFLLI